MLLFNLVVLLVN